MAPTLHISDDQPAWSCAAAAKSTKRLTASAAATAKLKALAADKRMQQLWSTISPGKKAAASGSDGRSDGTVPIDAALRAAVAKAMAVAEAAQRAAAAAIAAMPGAQGQ